VLRSGSPDPLNLGRSEIERYVRWLQEVRRYQPSTTRRLQQLSEAAGIRMPRMHPHMLRHTFVTTMLDAGVSLRDVQIAARHADPRPRCVTTGPAKNLDRRPNYILAAYMASGT